MKPAFKITSTLLIISLLAVSSYAADPNKPADVNLPSDPNTVVVKFGSEQLTLSDARLLNPGINKESLGQLANQWLELQMLYSAAQQRGLTNDPKLKLIAGLMSKEPFGRELRSKIAMDVNISDAQVKEYYEKNKNTDPALSEPNRYSFTHIRVATLAEANSIITRIKAGEDPAKIAKEISLAPDKQNSGQVRKTPQQYLARQYNDAFANALIAASEGQIIGPIEVRGQYEIARHEGKLSSQVMPYEKVQAQVKSNLERTQRMQAVENFMKDLRTKAQQQNMIYKSPLIDPNAK